MEELIDILDESQRLIGKGTRADAHRTGAWHRVIHGYLINSKGEIVMQKRGADKDLFPGYWDGSFAGHVNAGEDSVQTAIRECEEELGVKLEKDELKYIFTTRDQMQWKELCNNEFVDSFLCVKDFGELVKQDSEVDELKIVPLREFVRMIETRDENLFPHYPEFDNLVSVLKELLHHATA